MTQDLVKRLRARAFSSNTATHISVDLQAAADALEAKDARIAELEGENSELRQRNLDLEDAVDKMQEGIRAIQLHQSKRRK